MSEYVPIKGYEGHYSIAKTGEVFSHKSSKTLKATPDTCGYLFVGLSKAGVNKTINVHVLVWDTFGNQERNSHALQIDHIDGDIKNNHISNLQLLTNRDNTIKGWAGKPTSSKYAGVCWHKKANKWGAYIKFNGKQKYLGLFLTEIEAHKAYQKALEQGGSHV